MKNLYINIDGPDYFVGTYSQFNKEMNFKNSDEAKEFIKVATTKEIQNTPDFSKGHVK